MYASNFLETNFLNTLNGITFTAPAQLYVGLFLSDPTETGTAGIELGYTSYERKAITFSTPAPESGGIGIRNDIESTFAKSDVNAGTVTHIGIFDSKIGGNLYLYGKLTEPIEILEEEEPVLLLNEILYFSTGELSTAYKTKLFNVLRGQNITGFTPHYALFNGSADGGGTELSGANYARVPLNFGTPSETASGQMMIKNAQAVNFNKPTSNWGTFTHGVLYDNISGGEPVCIKETPKPKSILKGVMAKIGVEAIAIGLN